MKRRGSYLGGSTAVVPGSDWYSKEADPTFEDYKPTFQEILEDFINEVIIPDLDVEAIAGERSHSSIPSMHSPDATQDAANLIGYNSKKHDPKLYVPAEEGRKFVRKRANSPFKRPKRQTVIEYKSNKTDGRDADTE